VRARLQQIGYLAVIPMARSLTDDEGKKYNDPNANDTAQKLLNQIIFRLPSSTDRNLLG
jgi:hypothetical protein